MPRSADAAPPDDPDAALRAGLPAAEPALRRFLRSVRVPAAAVDDVVQEAFARAWRSRHGFSSDRPLEPWLFATALRAWLDLRARARRHPVATADAEAAIEPVDLDRVDARLDVDRLLDRLPDVERRLVERFHRDGVPLAELAAEHDMPVNTVKSHLHRARRRLADGGSR